MSEAPQHLTVGIAKETFPGERRVAVVPATIARLREAGLEVLLERGAGQQAGFSDDEYRQQGARLLEAHNEVFAQADILLQVRACGANPEAGRADWQQLGQGQMLIAQCEPLSHPESISELAQAGVTCCSLELLPRITRAQSMDVLSSMATIAGYKAVLMAADSLPRLFPMLMTAAGTLTPARVLIVGAGVAGLQAIATARRLGAVVEAYDVRPAVKEEVESLGARFVELKLPTEEAEETGGYAREFSEEFYRRQRELLSEVVAEQNVIVTTAAVPGKRAPVLITEQMVAGMSRGSIIVDLAAERGGNCELTDPDETVNHRGVTILGPSNLASTIPYHASQMYSRNITAFLLHLFQNGRIDLDRDEAIIRETLVTRGGTIVNDRVREALGLEPLHANRAS